MIRIEVQTLDSAWIAKLYAEVKGKVHEKELKGMFKTEEEIKDIIFSNLKSIKNLTFTTNNIKLKEILEIDNSTELKEDITFDFSEMIQYKELEDPNIPDFLNKSYIEIAIYESKEENDIAIGTFFVKAYMYFKENQDKVKEIRLLSDLKNKGIYSKDILMEDIFEIIEESFLN